MIDKYTELQFWNILAEKLAERDLHEVLIQNQDMDQKELIALKEQLVTRYQEGLDKGNFENLRMVNDANPSLN